MIKVSIIGLGYVGLPLALLCAEKELDVSGVDINKDKIKLLKEGISPIDDPTLKKKVSLNKDKINFSDDVLKCVRGSDYVIVCVPTPVDKEYLPNLEPLKSACESISGALRKRTTVIIESTIFPGTVEEIILPILKKSGLSEKDFYLAHCPERIDPGNKKYDISNLPRVVGGINEESANKALEFYERIINAKITKLSGVKAAEATKIMENTFRDINIAFVNEMAKSFDKAGIDITEVIKGASTKPFAFMPHYPGAGVGGHCIKVDPYYLIAKAKQLGFEHKFLSLARDINESMPSYAVELLEDEIIGSGKEIDGSAVGVMGLSYKADVDDIRESPALAIIEILKKKGANVFVYDPYLKNESNVSDLNELLTKSEYLILATDHKEFREMDLRKLKENGIKALIDGRNCLSKEDIRSLGIYYHGIGRS